jgi:hypothetical protein
MAMSGLLGGPSSDIIISGASELQDAEPVTEGVAHRSDATPRERLNFAFKLGAGRQSALDRKFNVLDRKVQMHRRPVAAVIAWQRNLRRGGAPRWFAQEVQVRRYPDHLGYRTAEKTPAKAEAKRTLVEGYALLKIIDVDVDEKLHCTRSFYR